MFLQRIALKQNTKTFIIGQKLLILQRQMRILNAASFKLNLIIIYLLILSSYIAQCYLQFKLTRIPDQSNFKKSKISPTKCPESLSALQQMDFKQVCYEKDISYSFQIYHNGNPFYISADLTTPISWIKGPQCLIDSMKQKKKCNTIQNHNLKNQLIKQVQTIKKKLKFHKQDKMDQNGQRQKAKIQGSSNIVKGYLQKPSHLSFQIMDSNRLTKLFDIILLGFYLLGQKDDLQLQSTQFINATLISQRLNDVSDGAISLRFDENSQNSFLNQIFDYAKTDDKVATIYLGDQSFLTLGQLSLKFTQHGYSSISWINISQDLYFGKLPIVNSLIIQETQNDFKKSIHLKKSVIFTLSASYIGFHSELVQTLKSKLSKSITSCEFQEYGYLKCIYSKKSQKNKDLLKSLTFSFENSAISVHLKDLVLHDESKFVIFNIKQLFQKDYIILGQPILSKYTLYFDYSQNKIGFAPKKLHFQKQFINIVSLIRFLVMVFTFGCCFILCSSPCRAICNHIFSKKLPKAVGKEGVRLRQYSPITQQNPYQQISQKIKSITQSRQTTEADGNPDEI